MKLDIELSEVEIHVIRMALEEYRRRGNMHKAQYGLSHVETLDDLALRFADLASIPLPTP